MKRKNTLLILFIIWGTLQSWADPSNLEVVRKFYPQIYTSIEEEAMKQWANDPKILIFVMEGQADAFIQIAESQARIDHVAMTNSLLYGSIKNEEEYNRGIIDDLSIENPYPLLRCDWYIVKTRYEKTKNIQPQTNHQPNNSQTQEKKPFGNDGIYTSIDANTKKDTKNNTYSKKERKFYAGGTSFDFILSNITGLNDWGDNANPGKGLEFRVWGRQPFGKTFFGMTEFSVNFIHHSIDDSFNHINGNLNQAYFKTAFLSGIYQHLSSTTTLIIGIGGFTGLNFSTVSQYDRDEQDAYPSSEDLKRFNYGFSGLTGIQCKRYEFALRGDWGMGDMSRDDFNFKTRTISISVGYLFNF